MSVYIVSHDNIPRLGFQSVTTILKQLDKSNALMPWACDMMGKELREWVESNTIEGLLNSQNLLETINNSKTAYNRTSSKAMDIGTQVHKLCEDYIKAQIQGLSDPHVDFSTLKIEVCNGFKAFLEWEKVNIKQWLESESKIVHPDLGYAGTLDAIAVMKEQSKTLKSGKKNILIAEDSIYEIDFKTSKDFYPEFGLQLSAYKEAREQMEGEYLFEHEYEEIVEGKKVQAFTNEVKEYKPIKIDGMGVLRLDKKTGTPFWKDYSKNSEMLAISWQSLLAFYYFFKNRKITNSPWVAALKELNNEMFTRIKKEGMEEIEKGSRQQLIKDNERRIKASRDKAIVSSK